MSRRTVEASRAIRAAWQKEQELISEGKGTRDWTPTQQKEILELGKAYYHSEDPNDDNDGKAFEGHHMKSAEAYPEYQGDPENIQFLSRSEHLEAHGGNYRNPTNGYFDPITKAIQNFGDNKYQPCEIIKLTDPIAVPASLDTAEASLKEDKEKSSVEDQRDDNLAPTKPSISAAPTAKISPKAKRNFGEKIMGNARAVQDFSVKHPVLTEVIKLLLGVAAVAVGRAVIENNKGSGDDSKSASHNDYLSDSSDDDHTVFSDTDDDVDSSSGCDNSGKRSSPKEHIVRASEQRYHTKDGEVWKKKDPYPRGGKHDEGEI